MQLLCSFFDQQQSRLSATQWNAETHSAYARLPVYMYSFTFIFEYTNPRPTIMSLQGCREMCASLFFLWFITSLAVARDILKLSGSTTARKQILFVSCALRDNLSSVPPHLTEIKNHKSNFKELRTCISRKFLSTYTFSASTSSSISDRVRLSPCTSPDKSHYDEVWQKPGRSRSRRYFSKPKPSPSNTAGLCLYWCTGM